LIVPRIALGSLLLWFFAVSSSHAFSGHDLRRVCSEQRDVCVGFVFGVQEAETKSRPERIPWVCVPKGVSAREIVGFVAEYLDDNIAMLDEDAVSLVLNALMTRWACRAPEQLTHLQGLLMILGHYTGPLDGKLSADTQLAIKRLQDARGMPMTGEYSVFVHSQAIAFYRMNEASIWISNIANPGEAPK
jgi:hypothetical protein